MKHRVAVTVSEPDHPSVSMRKETKEKFVRVTADSKDEAMAKAKAHYKKQGYKVHGCEYHSELKEEAEQIDELSKSTLQSYSIKAGKQAGGMAAAAADAKEISQYTADKDPTKLKKRQDSVFHKRVSGLIKAKQKLDKMSEDVESLDEISKQTLGSYVKKASLDATSTALHAGAMAQRGEKGDGEKFNKSFDKAAKRLRGIDKATDRLTKEEAEQIEESGAHQKDMDKNKPVFAQGVMGMKSKPFVKKFKSMDHYNKWADSEASGNHEVHRVYQESVEQIDEDTLSKVEKLMGDTQSRTHAIKKVADAMKCSHEQAAKHVDAVINRSMKKEEADLEEAAKWRSTSVAKKVTDPEGEDSESYAYHQDYPRSTGNLKATTDTPVTGLNARRKAQVATRGDRAGKVTKQHIASLKDTIKSSLRKEEFEQIEEAIKLGSKVKIHAPGKDYHDKVGHVGEIRHGAYKGAPKTYTVDYDDSKSIQLDKKNIKLHTEETEQIDELSIDTLASYKKKAGAQASQANKEGDIKKADKRFSGIVKATNKQFAAAVRKEEVSEERKSDPVPSVYSLAPEKETTGTYHVQYHGTDKDGNKTSKTYKLKAVSNHHAQSKAMKIARSEFNHVRSHAETTKFFKEELVKFSEFIEEQSSCYSKVDMIKKAVKKMKEEVQIEEEVEQLEEATLAYHVKKAADAKARGDDKKFAYHMENARTARYAMTGKEMMRNRHHLDKYNELRIGK